MESKIVIVADDDDFAQQTISMMLKGLQVTVQIAADGKQALAAYQANNRSTLSYVLMDLNMPVMDGFESTKQIRAYEKSKGLPPCKIIGLSGGIHTIQINKDSDEKTRQHCLTAGMNDLIAKPVKKNQLQSLL